MGADGRRGSKREDDEQTMPRKNRISEEGIDGVNSHVEAIAGGGGLVVGRSVPPSPQTAGSVANCAIT